MVTHYSIYNTFIKVSSQEDCDNLKTMCKLFDLPYWDEDFVFKLHDKYEECFKYDENSGEFFIQDIEATFNEVSMEEFIELIKYK